MYSDLKAPERPTREAAATRLKEAGRPRACARPILPQDDPHQAEDEGERAGGLAHRRRQLLVRVRRARHREQVRVEREHEQQGQRQRGRACRTRASCKRGGGGQCRGALTYRSPLVPIDFWPMSVPQLKWDAGCWKTQKSALEQMRRGHVRQKRLFKKRGPQDGTRRPHGLGKNRLLEKA